MRDLGRCPHSFSMRWHQRGIAGLPVLLISRVQAKFTGPVLEATCLCELLFNGKVAFGDVVGFELLRVVVIGRVIVVGGQCNLHATSGPGTETSFPVACHGVVHEGLLLGV